MGKMEINMRKIDSRFAKLESERDRAKSVSEELGAIVQGQRQTMTELEAELETEKEKNAKDTQCEPRSFSLFDELAAELDKNVTPRTILGKPYIPDTQESLEAAAFAALKDQAESLRDAVALLQEIRDLITPEPKTEAPPEEEHIEIEQFGGNVRMPKPTQQMDALKASNAGDRATR